VLSVNDLLRELRILKSPECKDTVLLLDLIHIKFTISYCKEIWVGEVEVHTRNVSSFNDITFEFEQVLESDSIRILNLLFFLFFFLFLLLLSAEDKLLTVLFFLLLLLDLDNRVVFIENMLLMVL